MKKKEWANPNKMRIDTGHKTFDAQTNVISTGNVLANTIHGSYIRGWFNEGEGLVDYPQNKRAPVPDVVEHRAAAGQVGKDTERGDEVRVRREGRQTI